MPRISRPAAGGRLVSMARPFLRATVVIAPLACTLSSRAASAGARDNEPRLIIPGGHIVRAGQLIDLRWSPADSVSELEILVSLDGGRHYSVCISPRLDPRRCDFVWRVPRVGKAALRMRIRFNRGGREIEGAPTAPLYASADGQPEPLALPPASGPAGERAPQSSGERGAPSG